MKKFKSESAKLKEKTNQLKKQTGDISNDLFFSILNSYSHLVDDILKKYSSNDLIQHKDNKINSLENKLKEKLISDKNSNIKLQEQIEELQTLEEELRSQNEELYNTREKLAESEEKYRLLSDLAKEAVAIHDKGEIINHNKAFTKIFGYTTDELNGKNIIDLLFENKNRDIVNENIKLGNKLPYRIQALTKNNTKIWVEIEADYITIDHKIYRVTLFRDITRSMEFEQILENKNYELQQKINELNAAENELLENYEQIIELNNQLNESFMRYRIIADFAYDWEHWLKPDGTFEYVSPSCERITGYKNTEFIENPQLFYKIIHPQDKYLWTEHTKQETHNEYFQSQLEFRICTKKGEIKWIGHHCNHIYFNGRYLGKRSTNRDITQTKFYSERIENILEGTNAGTFERDINSDIITINDKWAEIIGYTKEELLPVTLKKWENSLHEHDLKIAKAEIKKLLQKQIEHYDVVFRQKNKQGKWVWINARGKITKWDDKENPLAISGTHIDISPIKNYEAQLIEAKRKAEESDNLKSEFLKNLSHEIRTPINGIIGFSELLKSAIPLSEKPSGYINVIKESSLRLLTVIDSILEISLLVNNQLAPNISEVEINSLLDVIYLNFKPVADEKKLNFSIHKPLIKNTCINTDKSKLSKALCNIVENAVKFTPEGSIELGYKIINETLQLYIKDTGIGIDKSNADIIFIEFSQENKNITRDYGGLGLGLTIAKKYIETIGGKITYATEKGVGSTFYITLPYNPVKSGKLKRTNDKIQQIRKKNKPGAIRNILITEDEEINFLYLEAIINTLKKDNLRIFHAKNGKEALDFCKSNNNVDLILMDIKMPVMDGLEATKLIKEIRPEIPIIVQTAYITEKDKENAFAMGCNDFISKPIDKEHLLRLIDEFLFKNNQD